ncbi:unnamed protein product [Ranitomeya imitator]|uniref:Dynein heavy chain coiled coil stalk domain-containing protein n=1 Tax=Ranitomeya imitator TaxID=111125 RepID=A0ABN9MBL9_9NEOB|nr:unnamed protein product [Ranitomeya imitator]
MSPMLCHFVKLYFTTIVILLLHDNVSGAISIFSQRPFPISVDSKILYVHIVMFHVLNGHDNSTGNIKLEARQLTLPQHNPLKIFNHSTPSLNIPIPFTNASEVGAIIDSILANVKESISQFMAYVHTSVNEISAKYYQNEKRYNYTTPKSFLEQINLYKNLLDSKRKELSKKMQHLENGLQKLKTTASQVEDLKAKLASQEAELKQRNQDAEALIAKIGLQTEKVSQEKTIADAEEQKVASIQSEVSVKQKDCEDDLMKAEPALLAATTALNTLNKVNLTELKTFPNPPTAVINVTAAVMVLLAPRGRIAKDRSWKACKTLMGKVDDFLQALISYDKEHIHDNCLKVVKEQYLKDPEFNPDQVRSKSFAAAGLCAWVINIVKYYEASLSFPINCDCSCAPCYILYIWQTSTCTAKS